MSSQRQHVVQDYIVKIRYRNDLPPAPTYPKLLNVPGIGLESGQYTSAGYASRLAREQPLNIEADAELGMHIDLIGIPGVFEGDDRAIMASSKPQQLHPSDKALLRPLATLGRAAGANAGVSFLRRTEYTASSGPQMFASGSSKDLLRLKNDSRRKKLDDVDKDDPVNIARNIVKGFDVAYPKDAYRGEDSATNLRGAAITTDEIKAWANPTHPTKKNLQLLDSYPVLPDVDATPDAGSYMVFKFITNPVAATDSYDERLDLALLQPVPDAGAQADLDRRVADWKPDSGEPHPLIELDYDYFTPESEALRGVKRKFDVTDPENDDEELYTEESSEGRRMFKYTRLRRYETYNQHGDMNNTWNHSVAVALHDPETEVGPVPGVKKRLAKGAYIYPVVQRTGLRPKRKVGAMAMSQLQADRDVVDELDVTVRDLAESDESYKWIQECKARIDPSLAQAAA